MADTGDTGSDDAVVIRMNDGTWYGIPRAVVDSCRLRDEDAARLESEFADSEVEAYTYSSPNLGIAILMPNSGDRGRGGGSGTIAAAQVPRFSAGSQLKQAVRGR